MSEIELKNIAINCYSCMKIEGKKINYMMFIKDAKNEECNNAIKRVFNKIDIIKINLVIDEMSCISAERKEFYKKVLNIRYNILKDTYKMLV